MKLLFSTVPSSSVDLAGHPHGASLWRGTLAAAAVLAALALSACKPAATGPSPQVAATVNGEEVSIHQVRAQLARQPQLLDLGDQAAAEALDQLIDQQLLAQAARKEELDKTPEFVQTMELARRDALVQAYQARLASKLAKPSLEEVNRYHDEHPELFAQRRLFTLAETMVEGRPDELTALQRQAEGSPSLDAVRKLVDKSGLASDGRTYTLMSEDVPMDLLGRIQQLKVGQTVGVIRPQGLGLVTLVQAQDRPMSRGQAAPRIQAALLALAQRQAIQNTLTGLRQSATIVRQAGNTPSVFRAASAPAAAASSRP